MARRVNAGDVPRKEIAACGSNIQTAKCFQSSFTYMEIQATESAAGTDRVCYCLTVDNEKLQPW